MNTNQVREKNHLAFLRFSLTGVVFTILGPGLFWLAYPLGPLLAVAMAESAVHTIRFLAYQKVVFPAHKGYRVSPRRYILSALPVSLTGVISVALLRNRLDRTTLTLTSTVIAVVAGFLWSRFVYSMRIKNNKAGALQSSQKTA